MTEQPVWSETDSRGFLNLAEIAVTAREERTRALLDLIAAELHLIRCIVTGGSSFGGNR
jgi:hypothetical protein